MINMQNIFSRGGRVSSSSHMIKNLAKRHYEAFSEVGMASRAYEKGTSVYHNSSAVNIKHKTTYKTVNLKFGGDARSAIVRGIKRLAETAIITLGPGVRSHL